MAGLVLNDRVKSGTGFAAGFEPDAIGKVEIMEKLGLVCLIDDDDIYTFGTRLIIKSTKLVDEIMIIKDGERAIDYFKENAENNDRLPDLVLLDVNMPIMDGWQFLEEFLEVKPLLKKKVALYMVSSSINPKDMERAKKYDLVADYLVKPMAKKQLVGLIQGLIDQSQVSED